MIAVPALRHSRAEFTVDMRDAAFPLASGPRAARSTGGSHMLGRIGILGFLGLIIFIAWFVGWIFFGFHAGLYHLLFLIAVVLMIAQGVRRVAR